MFSIKYCSWPKKRREEAKEKTQTNKTQLTNEFLANSKNKIKKNSENIFFQNHKQKKKIKFGF